MDYLPSDLMQQQPWRTRAACLDHPDSDLWYPETSEYTRAKEARRICRQECPVRVECLADALENDERYGIRGGYTARERFRLIQKGRAA